MANDTLVSLPSYFTAKEIAIYFDPNTAGKIFARAAITAVTMNTGDTGRMDYEVQL